MPRRLPTRRGPPSRQPLQEEPANETPSDEEEIPTLHTGIRTTTADLDMNQHTRSSVRPYVVQDLKDAIKVDLYSWIEAVLGISSERIDTWTSQIAENKWFDDGIIQQHLKKYCEASTEPHRYQPFCELAGRILELARGCLDGIDRTDSYPVDSVQFINTSKRQVVRIPEHGLLGAERLLDITMTYGEAAEEFLKTNKIHWRDILHFVELKRSTSLVVALDKEKQRRARSSIPVSVPPTTVSPLSILTCMLFIIGGIRRRKHRRTVPQVRTPMMTSRREANDLGNPMMMTVASTRSHVAFPMKRKALNSLARTH